MAVEKTQQAQAQKTQEIPQKTQEPRQKLCKKIQSKSVLDPTGGSTGDAHAKKTEPMDLPKARPTAVKAKAMPTQIKVEVTEGHSEQTSRAVQECLRRPSTKDLVPPETPKTCPSQPVKARKASIPSEKERTEELKDKSEKNQDEGDKKKEKGAKKDQDEEGKEDKEKNKDVKPKPKKGKVAAPPAPPPPPGDDDDDSSDSEDSEEARKKEEAARVKREAHARYMRFSRSLSSILIYIFFWDWVENHEGDVKKLVQLDLPTYWQ